MDSMEEMELRLWEYIDGTGSEAERSTIERLVAEQAEWKAKYQELLEVHQSIQLVELEAPSLRFSKNVMEEIARLQIAPAARQYINNKVVWGIAAFFVTVILSFLVYGFSQINWSTGEGVNSDLLDKVTGADYSRMFNNTFVNGFMMLNVILGLLLFDRYLANRKRTYQKG
jgi:hypothetical protein